MSKNNTYLINKSLLLVVYFNSKFLQSSHFFLFFIQNIQFFLLTN